MRLPKLKFSVRPSDPLVYLRLSIMAITALILAGLCFVLYRDFYQTIVQAETVLVLKQEVALKDVAMGLFQKVRSINDYKLSPTAPGAVFDPFQAPKTDLNALAEINATTTPEAVDNQ